MPETDAAEAATRFRPTDKCMRGLLSLDWRRFFLAATLLLGISHAAYSAPADETKIRAYLDRGFALGKQGKWNESIAELRQAVALAPQSAEARYSLGVALFWTRQYSAAHTELQEAVRLGPGLAAAHFFLGRAIEADGGDLVRAAGHLEKAAQLEPRSPEIYRSLGSTLSRIGDLGGAIRAYREAARLRPDTLDVRNLLGLALVEVGDLSGAIAVYQQILADNPAYVAAKKNLGLALIRSGDTRAAERTYRELLAADKADAVSHYNLGVALRDQDRHEEAVSHFQTALRLKPGWVDPAIDLGKALWQLGRLEAAKEALRNATALETAPAEAWRALAASAR